ncbi:hypothetical protein PMZ80_001533 [Knufia obscura]|uniref:Threonine aspartase n=2 Tax=Knufia TaxID=430999 RepID=A0AAN8EP04_9EURO|nr:hypothetical protein PMZ80_001533 [Knufia obscura]KAK5955643.1 hypothetical protein OHC33_003284 [Knufia fluminis]
MHLRRSVDGGDLCAIYVHAGAGYHSTSNEKNHLKACNDAAKVGMAILKNGGDAIEAVEMAIRLLEDRDITNAGYGSNLTMDGNVEGDACIVDHYGRSGAVGALTQVKNPIIVARHVLDASIQPLSLSRVPPNFLVGDGAVDFAEAHGVNIIPNEYLVSAGAKQRWQNWRRDLHKAEAEERKQHERALTATNGHHSAPVTPAVASTTLSPPITPNSPSQYRIEPHNVSKHATADGPSMRYSRELDAYYEDDETGTDDRLAAMAQSRKRPRTDGSSSDDLESPDYAEIDPSQKQRVYRPPSEDQVQRPFRLRPEQEDHITDTVGAIAVDCFGRIAAGSSSGGIGMKHRGRCGPAALVGISTAVIPADPDDPEEASVATVTSGTGEHMATTAAAHIAADRILSCTQKVKGQLEPCNEDEAMFSMIKNDFMRHPGVQNSPCQGAIGILAVKKTKDGVYFYFGHNTDSFALASMHSDERKPVQGDAELEGLAKRDNGQTPTEALFTS